MKKIFLIILSLLLIPTLCFAAEETSSTHKTSKGKEVIIQSDTRTFDIMKGIYNLKGNVHVQIPTKEKMLTIKGDQTAVSLFKKEVHGAGNITLIYDDLNFNCDKVDVYHKDRTAYVNGNIKFKHDKTKITSDKASFSWKTKLAIFEGNVLVNGKAQDKMAIYHVIQKKFLDQLPPTK